MNIDGIQIYNKANSLTPATQLLNLPLGIANLSSSYILQSAYGLDLEEIIPIASGVNLLATDETFYDVTIPPRTLTFRIRLNPQANETYGSLRDRLFKAIAFDRTALLEVRFMVAGSRFAEIYGYLTKFESSIFTEKPEVQITIKCPYGLIRSYNTVSVTGLAPSIFSITDSLSTAPHGFKLRLGITNNIASGFTIQGVYGTAACAFAIMYPLLVGDVLYFSSEPDDRYLYIIRTSIVTHIIDKIAQGSIWPMLFPGNNTLGVSSASISVHSFTYRNHYWGI